LSQAITTTQQSGAAGGTGKPVVACQGLSKVFKDFWMRDRARAVDGVSFEINEHEIFGLLGPNGSGKSTTIKVILGLLRPTGGRIAVFGKRPTDVGVKKRIGYLPEESYLYPFLNARETLDYYGKLFELDYKTRQRRVDELLDMVGLSAAQFRQVREYSKGMQRRIGLAQALINDPDLLILDEPTTGLDPIGTRQVKDLITQLGKRGKTILLSSHLLSDVEDVVDRMVILYGGQIRSEGARDELLRVHDRTSIESDTLDDDTIEAIKGLIRERSGGAKEVRGVEHPRQKLERLFLDIVEQAQREMAATSGATNQGETAAFLTEGIEEGEALIDRLMNEQVAPMPIEGEQPSQPEVPAREESEDVIADLVSGSENDEQPQTEPAPEPAPPARDSDGAPHPLRPPADVDESVIDSLLDGGGGGGDDEDPDGDTKR